MTNPLIALTATAAMLTTIPAFSQHTHSGHISISTELPEVCRSDAAMPSSDHEGFDMNALNDHQRASMEGMAKMDHDMMHGMMQDDADVAFICGMIAHHQGAIDMARVELQYGDDERAKAMAQKIIDTQLTELEEMKNWLGDKHR